MKALLMVLFAFLMMTFSYCNLHKKNRYAIPEDYSAEQKDKLLSDIEKGEKLYKTSCADCHGKFMNGKNDPGDFPESQMSKYSARYILSDAKNHNAAMKMNPEQLNEIVLFLRYRIAAKTGIPVPPGGF